MQISFITVNKPQTKIILKSAPKDASNFNLTVQSTDYTGLKISADGVNYTDATAAPFVSTTGFIYLETKERLSHGSVTLTSANLQEAIWDPDVKFNSISFSGCTKLTKVPTFLWNACTSLASMFNGCSLFNQDISMWDTSKVTTLESMFYGAVTFNQPLNTWDVGNVTSMQLMFFGASAFNGDISSWNTSNVTNMLGTFTECLSFNQDISSWNTSKVTTMRALFFNASVFNQPLNNWDVSKVTDGLLFDVGATAWQAANKPKFV